MTDDLALALEIARAVDLLAWFILFGAAVALLAACAPSWRRWSRHLHHSAARTRRATRKGKTDHD